MFHIEIPTTPFEKAMRGVLTSFDRKAEADRGRAAELAGIAATASDRHAAKFNRVFRSDGSA